MREYRICDFCGNVVNGSQCLSLVKEYYDNYIDIDYFPTDFHICLLCCRNKIVGQNAIKKFNSRMLEIMEVINKNDL